MEGSSQSRNGSSNGSFKLEKTSRPAPASGDRVSLVGILGITVIIETVLAAGAYISFGATSDGGALLIRVLDGPDKLTAYCHTRQELLEALESLKLRYAKEYKTVASDPAITTPNGHGAAKIG